LLQYAIWRPALELAGELRRPIFGGVREISLVEEEIASRRKDSFHKKRWRNQKT
jgi:hypothetical protein